MLVCKRSAVTFHWLSDAPGSLISRRYNCSWRPATCVGRYRKQYLTARLVSRLQPEGLAVASRSSGSSLGRLLTPDLPAGSARAQRDSIAF